MLRNVLPGLCVLLSSQLMADQLAVTSPEAVGMSGERLQRVTGHLKAQIDRGELASAVAMVARKGKVVYVTALGKQNLETGAPMARDTLFRIYSMTKPITAVAALMLYEEGAFMLNDPLSKHIPQFADVEVLIDGNRRAPARPPTVQDLMRHTAGFTYGFFGNRLYQEAKLGASKDLEEYVDRLSRLPLVYEPGTKWNYSVSSDVLGYLVQRVSGMPFDEYLKSRLFDPLGMTDTFFEVPRDKLHRFGTNHIWNNAQQSLAVTDSPAESEYADEVTLFMGGAGLISTIDDYMRFALMLVNRGQLNGTRILSSKTIELMSMDHLEFDAGRSIGQIAFGYGSGYGFGLGFGVVNNVAAGGMLRSRGEYFWAGAAGTTFWIDPVEKIAGVAMIQLMGAKRLPLRTSMRVLTNQALID